MTKQELLNVVTALSDIAEHINDAQEDDDRGRGHDAICLLIGERGNWHMGTAQFLPSLLSSTDKDELVYNEQMHGDSPAELVQHLNGWLLWDGVK